MTNKSALGSKPSESFFDRLQFVTEKYLTFRRRLKRIRKEKQQKKNVLLDWLEAFLWAAGMVLLINQYLFQAYQIPSGSMIDTLLVGDRVFVNKIIYGPELLPGIWKIPSPIKPKRNDIIIFENPNYFSRGPAFDIAQRIIYMLTLSMVDIDKDDYGEPKPHFLIKRAAGVGGDWLVQDRGNMRIRPEGESRWMDEREFNALRGITHNIRRLVNESAYPSLEAAGRASAYTALGLEIPPYLKDLLSQADLMGNFDNIAKERARLEVMRGVYPHDSAYSASLAQYNQGFYIPKTRILPLGDNRDNSRDGRSFGPVMASKILGKGSIIYWPGDFRFRRFAALERFGFFK